MHTASRKARRIAKLALIPVEVGIVAVVPSITVFRLGNMYLDGLPTAFGASLALLAAMTSLLYNRARAYPPGKTQRRTLLAAELSLRALVMAICGVVLAAFIFPYLISLGFQTTPWMKIPLQPIPTISAFVIGLFFLRSAFFLLYLGRVIAPSLLTTLSARQLAQATRQ